MKKKESFAVTLVIPAFNEAARIEANLQKISAFRNHCDYHLQCIIVNDGSRDQTETTINDFPRHHSELRRIKQKINHNKPPSKGVAT
ncbi:glycosyltransferase [bacterium]|nr:glycosyltransferase [bacterium]